MTKLTLRAGRYPKTEITGVRDLARDDLKVLAQPRAKLSAAQRFKDPHHRIARLFASGLRMADVIAKTGYSYGRVATLHADPSFQNLIAEYRSQVNDAFIAGIDEYYEVATSNMILAERQLAQKLLQSEEDDDLLPTRDLIAISRDAADRFGYGKKTTNVNLNIDFAAKLERARQRSGKQIDVLGPPQVHQGGVGLTTSRQTPPPLPQPSRMLRRA